jgi:hypothetical protein
MYFAVTTPLGCAAAKNTNLEVVAVAISVSRTQMVPAEDLSDTPVDHLGSRRLCWLREPSDIAPFSVEPFVPNFYDLTV